MSDRALVRWFDDIRLTDVLSVGGKTASLGELRSLLGGRVPDGFALTAEAYRGALAGAGVEAELRRLFDDFDHHDVARLAERAAEARRVVYEATGSAALRRQIIAAYRELEERCGRRVAVAVRSSATAEDLPTASFAGQHESFLNVRGGPTVVEACRRCFASIFTDRAIVYRIDNGFDHFKVALSVAVMKMVRSDLASSGVIFTLDTETGFRDVVFVTGCCGLGENIVQGEVDPDEFYVHKPTFRQGYRAVLSRRRWAASSSDRLSPRGHGDAQHAQSADHEERARAVLPRRRGRAGARRLRYPHRGSLFGARRASERRWTSNGRRTAGTARSTSSRPGRKRSLSRRNGRAFETYALKGAGTLLATGRAVGEKIAAGVVRVVADAHELAAFRPGEVLVAETTTPDWEPVMKTARAIVTRRGGRTCHAAIVARELGVPAVVGAEDALGALPTGTMVTVCCAEGETGTVYAGELPFEVTRVPAARCRGRRPRSWSISAIPNWPSHRDAAE